MSEANEYQGTHADSASASSASSSVPSAFRLESASSSVKQKAKRKQPPRPKHIPQRTCIACKQVRPKRELIRIVRTPDGHILLDETGKKSGRGAYLCAKRSCWEPAVRKGKLEHEFETTLLSEDRAALEAYIETLPIEAAPAPKAKRSRLKTAGEPGSKAPTTGATL